MNNKLFDEIYDAIKAMPAIDVHTHLVGGKLLANGLHDILLYHMAISDLYSSGCPNGARLTEFPNWPTEDEAESRIIEALPYLKYVQNTSTSWGVRIILEDLYDWTDRVSADNWQKLHKIIQERKNDKTWQQEVMRKAGIRRFCTELARRGNGEDDEILSYSLEWAFFTRCKWGEFDTALYELERCWGELPGPPTSVGAGARPDTKKVIKNLDDVHEAISWYVDHIPAKEIVSMATHISTDIDYRLVSDRDMADALKRRSQASPTDRDIYASYINEAFLTALEQKIGGEIVFQFSFGAEPLPFETASRLSQRTIAQLADMISRHPKLHFQCFLSSQHANQSLCTLCRELPNLSLAGYWWHNFFPPIIRNVIDERLDMIPANKQVGFFSDSYCLEWAYAKSVLVRKQLAQVLVQKIEQGQYDIELALEIARQVLFETPQKMFRFTSEV